MKIRILQATETDTRCVSCGNHIKPGAECIRDLTIGIPTIPLALCLPCCAAISSALLGSSAPTHVVPPPASAMRTTPYTWQCPNLQCRAQVDNNHDTCAWCCTARPVEAQVTTECSTT